MTRKKPEPLFQFDEVTQAAIDKRKAEREKYEQAAKEYAEKKARLSRTQIKNGEVSVLVKMVANDFQIDINDVEQANKLMDAVTKYYVTTKLDSAIPDTGTWLNTMARKLTTGIINKINEVEKRKLK